MGTNPGRDDSNQSDTSSEGDLRYIIVDNFDKFATKPKPDVKYIFIERYRVEPPINKYSISLFLLGMVFFGLTVTAAMIWMEATS
ncbi:hypothetical protein AVEN_69293-1 [Araneus ventricosus]|uniref:Uncharacterized protein n=1 Tax=Araneus ventricosus TaxID=182803 RepID=A0A4Y2PPT5_ARAVE|nr:hypothetical protein AVEN_69293-1 [Araneus ventricosus]